MALLIDIKHPDWLTDDELRNELLGYYPEADIRIGTDPGRLDEIEMLTVSSYYPGEALKYPNLKVIQKTGAGVNNILADIDLPESIEVVRLQAGTSGAEMAEYALAFVLQEQRHLRQYHAQQARSEWISYPPRRAVETIVAVLGLGRIGQQVAQRFVDNGFRVSGWSRSQRQLEAVDCYAGETALHEVLAHADYVISVLPSTPQTKYLFNRALFAQFKPSSFFINMGRGDLVDENDLIQALDDGELEGAVLDVMSIEPLPTESPLWLHPRLQLTPHISGYHLGDAIADIAENYRRLKAGEALLNPVDRALGY
ncbi:MAG: glyoxylate/hydroxypyruvate reductase A [Gammaproteobacteria bacterium]|nr:MAG: glyoxylate/hydroxypyruvate reductase A [Gammaproteobacteria bacterium]UCH41012.1 MAG: glyoxylate/hydroxypyruvate reductase A [Gammaproteobacteria bacterium]